MQKNLPILLSIIVFSLISGPLPAADVKIQWSNPDKYTDIRPADESKIQFRKRLFRELEQQFREMSGKLPQGHQLEIVITDLDLAGHVRPVFEPTFNYVRIVNHRYYPKMTFSFSYYGKDNQILNQGHVSIRDTSSLLHQMRPSRQGAFVHERKMIDKWFRKQFG